MLPLARLSRDEARSLEVLLFDLDDTVLTHGSLGRAAFNAIHDLHEHGLKLLAVTGRPSGWGEILARQWPLLGVVAENGAAFVRREGMGIVRVARQSDLSPLVAEIRAAFPEIELADDNRARLTDVTFDIGEQHRVPRPRIEELRAFVQSRGARALVSSVHLHATYEGDDKASGTLRVLRQLLGYDAGRARARSAFIGDSENDAACFACFRTTIGVANVAPYAPRLSVPPRFITKKPMGDGFAELAEALISLRT